MGHRDNFRLGTWLDALETLFRRTVRIVGPASHVCIRGRVRIMNYSNKLIVIDGDPSRRTMIRKTLADSKIHVEPFDSVKELAQYWPSTGTVVIHDEEGSIAEIMAAMAQHNVWMPVIAYSEKPQVSRIVAAILEGALEYADWPIRSDEFSKTFDRAIKRAAAIGALKLKELQARNRMANLTRREQQVLNLLARGLSNKLIGEELAISPRTVEIHRANLYNKLGARGSADAIRIAIDGNSPIHWLL